MNNFFASLFVFLAGSLICLQNTHASTTFASAERPSLNLASLAAGLPPVQGREYRQPGLPPAERDITKPPELEPKPIPAPTRGLPPATQKLPPKEDRRPGLTPPPVLTPVIRGDEDHEPGLPPKK